MSGPGEFDGFFACEVLDVETKHQHTVEALGQFFFECLIVIGIVSVAEQTCISKFLLGIFYDMDAAECDDRAEVGGVFLPVYGILRDDTERCLLVFANGINLVAFQCAVEKDCPISVNVTEGDGIGMRMLSSWESC